MSTEPYYFAYEKRYHEVFKAGVKQWGHSPEDTVLFETLSEWVSNNHLKGKSIIEFACGEGACGVILSNLGCQYLGVDISPTVVQKAKETLKTYPNTSVCTLDMVKETIYGKFDAALDCMGLHMLVTDSDREIYLRNANQALNIGAPMLFFREAYEKQDNDAATDENNVHSFEEWEKLTGCDFKNTELHRMIGEVEVTIPLVPARARDKAGYLAEMKKAGFLVEDFIEMEASSSIQSSASIYARKSNPYKKGSFGTLSIAKQYANKGQQQEWLQLFLRNDGKNIPFADGLLIEKRYYLGPVKIDISTLGISTDTPEYLTEPDDIQYFHEVVERMKQAYHSEWDTPPLIVGCFDGKYEINDGRHRYIMYHELGIKEVEVLFWMTKKVDAIELAQKYGMEPSN